MTDEVLSPGLETELFVDRLHRVLVEVDTYTQYGPLVEHRKLARKQKGKNQTLVGCGIFILPSLQEREEVLGAPFLEEAHKRALDCFHLGGWYL